MARAMVARRLASEGKPQWREGFVTDNGGHILDIQGLQVDTDGARQLESRINDIPGVVCCGFFALAPAHVALVATQDGVKTLQRPA